MSRYTVVKHVVLTSKHVPTSRTRHYAGGELLPSASLLKIARFEEGGGVYLFHFDANGKEMTDTFHDSEEEALAQADGEYGVKPSEWKLDDRGR